MKSDLVWLCEAHHSEVHRLVKAGKCKLIIAHTYLKQNFTGKVFRIKKRKRNRGFIKWPDTKCIKEVKEHLKYFETKDAVKRNRKAERVRIKALREERLRTIGV